MLNGIGTTSAHGGVFWVAAHIITHLPAPIAFFAFGTIGHNTNTVYVWQGERALGNSAFDQLSRRGDGNFGQINVAHGFDVFSRHKNFGGRLQAGPNAFFGALYFQCPGHNPAQIADLFPFVRQGIVLPLGGHIGEQTQMHAHIIRIAA